MSELFKFFAFDLQRFADTGKTGTIALNEIQAQATENKYSWANDTALVEDSDTDATHVLSITYDEIDADPSTSVVAHKEITAVSAIKLTGNANLTLDNAVESLDITGLGDNTVTIGSVPALAFSGAAGDENKIFYTASGGTVSAINIQLSAGTLTTNASTASEKLQVNGKAIGADKAFTYSAAPDKTITLSAADATQTIKGVGDATKVILGSKTITTPTFDSDDYTVALTSTTACFLLKGDGTVAPTGFQFGGTGDKLTLDAKGKKLTSINYSDGTAVTVNLSTIASEAATIEQTSTGFKISGLAASDALTVGDATITFDTMATAAGGSVSFTKAGELESIGGLDTAADAVTLTNANGKDIKIGNDIYQVTGGNGFTFTKSDSAHGGNDSIKLADGVTAVTKLPSTSTIAVIPGKTAGDLKIGSGSTYNVSNASGNSYFTVENGSVKNFVFENTAGGDSITGTASTLGNGFIQVVSSGSATAVTLDISGTGKITIKNDTKDALSVGGKFAKGDTYKLGTTTIKFDEVGTSGTAGLTYNVATPSAPTLSGVACGKGDVITVTGAVASTPIAINSQNITAAGGFTYNVDDKSIKLASGTKNVTVAAGDGVKKLYPYKGTYKDSTTLSYSSSEYAFVTSSGTSYFTIDSAGAIDGFVLGAKGDSLTLDASGRAVAAAATGIGFLDSKGKEVKLSAQKIDLSAVNNSNTAVVELTDASKSEITLSKLVAKDKITLDTATIVEFDENGGAGGSIVLNAAEEKLAKQLGAITVDNRGILHVTKMAETDVTVNKGTINVNVDDFKYDNTKSTAPVLDLSGATAPAADVVVKSSGAATQITLPALSTVGGTTVTIGKDDFKVTADTAGAYFTVKGSVATGFSFKSAKDQIVFKDGIPKDFKLYNDGTALTTLPTVSGGEVAITKKTEKDFALTVGDGAKVEYGGKTLEFDLPKGKYAMVTFSEDKGITAVDPVDSLESTTATTFAADTAITVTGDVADDDKDGIQFITGTTNNVAVGSGKYTFTSDGTKATITLGDTKDESVYKTGSAAEVHLGLAEGTITDGSSKVKYGYNSAKKDAYFTADTTTGKINGFVFVEENDALTINEKPSDFTTSYMSGTTVTPLTTAPKISKYPYTVKMTDDAPIFTITGIQHEAEVSNSSGNKLFTFEKEAKGDNSITFKPNIVTGLTATKGTVTIDAAGATLLNSSSDKEEEWFQLNGKPVKILATAGSKGMTFDADNTALSGLADAAVTVTNAGVITKIYVPKSTAGVSFTFGTGTGALTYTAHSADAKKEAYFAVDGDKTTGFVFGSKGDFITTPAANLASFELKDGAEGDTFSAPTVTNATGAAKSGDVTITKVTEKINKVDTEGFSIKVEAKDVVALAKGAKLTFGDTVDSAGADVYFDKTGQLLCVTGISTTGAAVTVENASAAVYIGETVKKVEAIDITGTGAWTYQMVDKNGKVVSAIKGLTSGVKVVQSGSVEELWTAPGKDGEFTFGEKAFTVAGADKDTDGIRFDWDGTKTTVTGISSIDQNTSIAGALDGLKFKGGTAGLSIGTGTYTIYGGGLSLAGLTTSSSLVNAGGISNFLTTGEGNFKLFGGSMSIAGDTNGVTFTTDGATVLTGIESLTGSAIGDFTGGLSVNSIGVQVTGDSSVEVVGDDTKVTAIKQLGVADAATAINVSASTATLFGVDKLGKFDFNGTAFGVSGTNTAETTFNLSASAITGIDVGEFVTGGFSTAAWTINESNKLQVSGDSSITIVNGASGIGFTGMAAGASLVQGVGFSFAQTEGEGKFTFKNGSFSVANDKNGVTFMLDGAGNATAVSGLEGTISGNLSELKINDSEIKVISAGGSANTNLTYADGVLSGIVNGDSVYGADHATTVSAGVSGTFYFDAKKQTFKTSDADGIDFTVKVGTTEVTAIDKLAAGASLEGAIAGLSVNTKLVDITNDTDFGVIGAAAGVSAIYNLSGDLKPEIVSAGGATQAITDKAGEFTFKNGSFSVAGDDVVTFTLSGESATAIAGLSGNVTGDFSAITTVNGKKFDVKDADDKLTVYGNTSEDDLTKIAGVTGGASIGEIGSVSQILTDKAGEFVFTVGSQSFTTADDDTVTFGMSSSKVTSISALDGSVTGNFTGIKVNGATIDIIGDDEITVVGDGTKLTAIQGVDADATINAAGSVAQLVGNISASSGTFTFKDNGAFVIAGDSSVTFALDTAAAAKVTGISGIDGPATVTGGLSQVAFNGNSMSVAGDADNQFSYMLDAAGKATLGGVGGEKVTVSGVGGANFVQITEQGNYDFFGTAYGLSLASGESSVLFGTDGKQVTSVADLEGTLKGDFSAAGFTVNGKEFEIAGDSSVGIVGSGSGVTKIVDLSGGANVKGVGGASVAITDSEGKFTFTNGSFSIAGDADGVTFMLDGDKVVGIKDLNEGATLTGSLDQLNSINGAKLDIKDDKDFGVVGAASGISKVVDLSTPANVVNAGGASQAAADTGETFTFPNGTFTISGDSAATFDLDAKTSEVTNIGVKAGATVSGPLNGIAINGGESLNVVGDTVFGAVAGDSKLAQLINLSGGANVVGAGGASQFVTDSEGEFTILSTAMEISGDDSVMFTAGTSGITAIDSLEGTAIGDFNNVIAVNSNEVKILGDSSIEVTSDGTAVTAINAVTGSDAPTIAAVGGATEIGTDAAGTFTFTTGGDSKAFTVGEDDEVTFTLEDGAVTGVNALENGTLGFKDVTDLTVNETELTIDSTQNVSLSIADSAVVYVKGVDGEIRGLENATVAATGAMTVNDTDINVQGDEDYKVIVQDGAVVGLTDVSAGATVNVAGVSIAVNESGDFQIGGNTYTFTDENNAFTLTTGDDSQLSGVDELEGNVVIAAPADQSLTVNDDELAFASGADSVTVAAGASGITAVNGLIDKDGVTVAAGASIAMLGSTASVSTEGAQLKVNEVTYTLLNDADGITVTGGREVTGLDENASLYVSEKGKYTVNGNGSDIEVEDTAMPIIGLDNATDAYIYDPANLIVRKGTPVSSIEQMLGLTTKYPEDPGFGTADDPLTSAEVEAVFGASSTADLDKPIETFATNETKDPQDINLANTDFSKKVHLFDGPQSVEFNNFGGNEAIIERENPDGSATGGEKAITLGNGGDAVIMKADAGNGSAVDVTGGTGDDSVVVQGSAPVNFDMSAGGDDKIVTFASSGARVALNGYDALANPNAGIHITERWASIANAILTGLLSFGDGVLNINSASGDTAKIEFAGHTDPIGAVLVNLFDYLGRKQAVGFTNSGGGLADFSAAVEPMILIGNDGNKTGASSLLGGSGDDTAFAGGGDEIDLGLGNNEIVLDPSTTREGAGIALTRGRTTIDNFNGTFNLDHGDVIATDLSAANISFDGTNVYIEGDGFYGVIANAKPDGAISYDEALTESADEAAPLGTKSGDYTNVLFNNAGVLVKTAIAKEGGVMDVKLDQDQRALNYIGDNSGLTFYDHTGEVLVNLADGTGSIDTADALFSGINSVAAGAGQTTIIGADDNETLIAGTGTGSIWGAGGDNLMRGNTDSGKTGQTSFFVVAEKDGARNTIESFNFVTDDNYTNTNKITADKLDIQVQYDQIQTENGGVAISGNDVVLLVNNRNEAKAESVIIKDAVGKDFIVSGDDIIDDVIAQVNVDKLTADKFANYFVATGKNATLTVSDEFDKANIYLDSETPLGSDHEGEIPQFYGDFKVIDATGSNAKVELGGNELDNTILAGTGDSSLWGGNGGNDLLVGGAGKNSFFYNYGNGNDTIQGVEDGDVIDLTNISLDDIVDANNAIGDNGVKLQFTDGNTLTVEGTAGEYLIGDDTYVVEDGKWSKKA